MIPAKHLAALAVVGLAATACATADATTSAAPAPVTTTIPPDLGGHQYDRPDADHVLVAGDGMVLTLPTGRLKITVNGPALALQPQLVKVDPGSPYTEAHLPHFLATFTVTATVLSGTATLSPADLRLLAIADQVDGGARVTTTQTVTSLLTTALTAGQTWKGTWVAPFVEGHGELLFTPPGATRPAALWDFRAES